MITRETNSMGVETKTMHDWSKQDIETLAAFMHQRWERRGGHSFHRIPLTKRESAKEPRK